MGTDGGAEIQGYEGKMFTELYDRAVDVPLVPPRHDEGERLRLSRHFLDCIREGKEPISSAFSGLTNSLILDAIYESSRTGHEVTLDWNL